MEGEELTDMKHFLGTSVKILSASLDPQILFSYTELVANILNLLTGIKPVSTFEGR